MNEGSPPEGRSPMLRTIGRWAAPVTLVLLLALTPGLTLPYGPSGGAAAPSSGHARPIEASGRGTSAAPLGPPPSSGNGSFVVNTTMPFPATQSHELCLPSSNYPAQGCYNVSTEPSIVSLRPEAGGAVHLALAYTTITNATSCSGLAGNTTSAVAFSTYVGGTGWSTPTYHGPTNCSKSNSLFADAWQPSLAVLGNGTLVMAYVQYNQSWSGTFDPIAPYISCAYTKYDRIVVTDSYDNGSTWTPPVVAVNGTNTGAYGSDVCSAGSLVLHPSLAAHGSDVYLAYTNVSDPLFWYENGNYGDGQAHLTVSTNGGASWSTPILLHGLKGGFTQYGYKLNLTTNPQASVSPSGKLVIAYVTGFNMSYSCSTYCVYNTSGNIFLAESTNNGSTINYTNLGVTHVGQFSPEFLYGNSYDPIVPTSPTVAFSPQGNGQAYLVYTGYQFGYYCYTPQYYYSYCAPFFEPDVYLRVSSNNATTFGPATPVAPELLDVDNGSQTYLDTPSVAVDANGTVYVQFGYANGSLCLGPNYSTYVTGPCAPHEEYLVWSTDEGASFSPPVPLETQGLTGPSVYGSNDPEWWYGEYTSIVATGGNVYAAYATEDCFTAVNGTSCPYVYGSGSYGQSRLVVSSFYRGPSVTLSFSETGLPSGTRWSVDVDGNVRSGPAGTTLSVGGVPSGGYVSFVLPWVNRSFGVAYQAKGSSGGSWTTSSTVAFTFHVVLLVETTTDPPVSPKILSGGTEYTSTLTFDPVPPSAEWVAPGTAVTLSETYGSLPCSTYCDSAYNISFLSWTGTGNGSVSSNASSITVKPTSGPINETANLRILEWCDGYTGTLYCTKIDYGLTFAESGLPSGTSWAMTIAGGGSQTHQLTSGSVDGFSVLDQPVRYYAWAVAGAGGMVYEPSEFSGVVDQPTFSAVPVRFSLVAPDTETFTVNVSATGLPGAPQFDARIGTGDTSGRGYIDASAPGGTALNVSSDPVIATNGTGYVATSATWIPYEVGAKWVNVSLPSPVTFNSSGALQLHYAVEYRLTTQSDLGGRVTPSSEWVLAGTTVSLTEAPDAGYFFVGWSGTGPGASGSTQRYEPQINITPAAPVTEIATFRPIPAETWNVTFVAGGLPAGTAFQFRLGSLSFGGIGRVTIGEIATGTYGVSYPTVAANDSNGTRFVAGTPASTLPGASTGELLVNANGTVWLNFSEQFALTVSSSPWGSISPGTGLFWEPVGASVPLVAHAERYVRFLGWNGTGANAVSASTYAINVTLTGPTYEAAGFQRLPNPPATTYGLTVTETGLPSGLPWSVAAGAQGTAGNASALTIADLNGSYAIVAPPVLVAPGVRYVSNLSGGPRNVSSNGTLSVSFTEQFALTVLAGIGGNATAGGWYPAGASVSLTATSSSGEVFVGWSGTGSGAVTSSSPTISVVLSGPVNESATFAARVTATTTGSASAGLSDALGILVVLAVVGLLVGYLIARPRRPGPPPEESSEEGYETGEASMDEGASLPPLEYETASAPAAAPAPYDEGGDEYRFEPLSPDPAPAWSEDPAPSDGSEER